MRSASLCTFLLLAVSSAACSRSASYYTKKGDELLAARRYADASLNYRKALQKDSNSVEAYYRLGVAEARQQHFDDAWQFLNRAHDLAPQRNDVRIELGELCLAGLIINEQRPQNLYNRLNQLSGELLAGDPNSYAGLRFKGYLAMFDRHMDAAVDYFQRALHSQPGRADVAVSLMEALFQTGRETEAERIARDFIQADPSEPSTYDALYAHYSARGRNAEAEEILKRKLANNPNQPTYATQLASFYWRIGKQAAALDVVAKMLSSAKPSTARYIAAGDFFGSVSRWQDATAQFEKGLAASPADKVLFQKRIANVLLAQDKKIEGRQLVDQILKTDPKDAEARRIRAGLNLESKAPQAVAAAVAEYKDLLNDNPNDANLHYDLGLANAAAGDRAAAASELQAAIRLQPGYLLPRNSLAELAIENGKPTEALRWCDDALAISPQDTRSRFLKAIALRSSGQYDASRRELNSLLRDLPGSPEALLQLALLEIEAKNYKAAQAALAALEKSNPGQAAGGLAALYASLGQVDQGIQVLKKATGADPVLLHNLIGALAMRSGKYDLAIQEYGALAASAHAPTDAYLRLADAYRSKNDWAGSIATLEKAQMKIPQDASITLVLASSFETVGRLDQAMQQYRRALALRPDDAQVLNNLAFLTAETNGDLTDALRMAQQAVRKSPDRPEYLDTLGWIYLKQHSADSAVDVFRRLIAKEPANSTFRYHLGAALLAKGDGAAARESLQIALEHNPSRQDAQSIRQLLAQVHSAH